MVTLEPGLVFADRYLLQKELGRGGMGSVWEAVDERLDRPVAIKTMIQELADNETALARFQREARAAAKVHSPHIVEIHDYGVSPVPFMVMERLQGEDLKARHKRRGALQAAEVASIVVQVAKALAAAHQQGIVHRDLKPGNVFLMAHQDEDFVKVFDFGIAKAFHGDARLRRLTLDNMALGTPVYMSPEQLLSKPVDHRADVWALAVIAYRCLTGALPFRGLSLGEIVDSVLEHNPRPPSQHDPFLPAALDQFFERAFAVDIDQRFQTAKQLAEALCDVLGTTLDGTGRISRSELTPAQAAAPFVTAATGSQPEHTAPTAPAHVTPGTAFVPIAMPAPASDTTEVTLKKQGGWSRRDGEASVWTARSVGVAAAGVAIAAIVGVAGWLALWPSTAGHAGAPSSGEPPTASTAAELPTAASRTGATATASASAAADESAAAPASASSRPPLPAASSAHPASSQDRPSTPATRPPAKPAAGKKPDKPTKSGDDLFDSIY